MNPVIWVEEYENEWKSLRHRKSNPKNETKVDYGLECRVVGYMAAGTVSVAWRGNNFCIVS
jgi:hypothetical protein